MKEKVLSMVSKAIERSTEQELCGRAPLCEIGIWYQPKRPYKLSIGKKEEDDKAKEQRLIP